MVMIIFFRQGKKEVRLTITNPTDKDWSQISTFITSDNQVLTIESSILGKISSGATVSKSLNIQLPSGYGTEKGR